MRIEGLTNYKNPLYLFSNFVVKGASAISGLISDHKSIKNGSYNKLVSAYYDKIDNKNKEKNEKNYYTYNSAGKLVKGLNDGE